MRECEPFILKRVLELESLKQKFPPKELRDGDEILFYGRATRLSVIWTWRDRIRVNLLEGEIEMLAPLSSTRNERVTALRKFFLRQARLHLPERLAHFARVMGLQPRRLSIRGQRTLWGSCTSDHVISLNWKLLACPETVIDYVVIHELAHIPHPNHSERFWELVKQYYPEHKAARRWLREHQPALSAQFESERQNPSPGAG